MRLKHLITSIALVVLSVAGTAQSQDLMGFDRASFGSVVLSRTQAVGTDFQLELSVGSYENEPISNYSDGSIFAQIGRSVGRLDVLTDKGVFPCTAFIVSKKYILTNYHCSLGILDNERIGATQIQGTQFVAGYTQTGIDEGTKKYMVVAQPIEVNKALDYAVLEVLGDPSEEYGQLKLASVMPTDGDPFWIIGHPMGEGQRISREKCKANAPAVSAGKLLHTCDTLPGNSGSPVIDAGLQQVVALHHAGSQKDSVNFAILMSKILENSTVLAAYRAPDAVPKAKPVEPKTAAISACGTLYSEAKETKECYAYRGYIKQCVGHVYGSIAQSYIQEFCQPQKTVAAEKTCDDDPSICSIDQLCGQSLTFKSGKAGWRTDNVSYVAEAKRRGLSCGVTEVVAAPKKYCALDVSACIDYQLCKFATSGSTGQRIWSTKSGIDTKHVTEAKRRGLSCGVDETKLIKTAFKNQSVLKRKQIQYALKKLNSYKSSIDALYGPGTEKALINFAKSKSLNINNPEKIFKSVLSQVSVPSSFAPPRAKNNQRCGSIASNCSKAELCSYSTMFVKNGLAWKQISYQKHVTEAKRRGLNCGVK